MLKCNFCHYTWISGSQTNTCDMKATVAQKIKLLALLNRWETYVSKHTSKDISLKRNEKFAPDWTQVTKRAEKELWCLKKNKKYILERALMSDLDLFNKPNYTCVSCSNRMTLLSDCAGFLWSAPRFLFYWCFMIISEIKGSGRIEALNLSFSLRFIVDVPRLCWHQKTLLDLREM